ncbi:MAG: STAS/SEC14 domain-containing protein [Verrucomicrobiales bacterium]|nr:STAS/SEC14 domain-containing protein [Verrucomicrobiota bacterium JB025]
MITHHLSPTGILTLHPSGAITRNDFTSITETVDQWLERGNTLKGLIIEAESFPGWKDFAGLSAHLRFVKNHHLNIPRVAFLSDSGFLAALPRIGRHFVNAELRHFNSDALEAALDWINSPPQEKTHALHQAWFPAHHLIWLRINGRITTAEYKAWIEDVKSHIQQHGRVSFLIDIDNLDGVDFGALVADLKFGLTHLTNIKRIALTGHLGWARKIAAFPNPFPFEIKAFDDNHEYDAWSWLTAD